MEFDFPAFISQVGFPGAICIYVLSVMNKTLSANTKAINDLTAKIGGMKNADH